MSMTKLDTAISVITFILKRRKKKVDALSLHTELTESQKIDIGNELDLHRNVDVLIKEVKRNREEVLGKLPPQDLDLERIVLGSVMLEVPALDKVKDFLKPEHFYLQTHQLIYKSVSEVRTADMRQVVNQLKKSGHIEIVGGPSYILELTAGVHQTVNIETHARILIEMAVKRSLILMAGKILHDGYDDTVDFSNVLEDAEKQIATIKSWLQ